MSCSISIGGGDDDGYPDFWTVQSLKARKVYRCVECRSDIAIGEQYQRCTYRFDGEFHSDKTCEACAEIRAAFSDGGGCIGAVWDDIREQFSEITTACFDQLETVVAKRKLREQWMIWKGLAPWPAP